MKIFKKKFEELTNKELYEIMKLREEIFVLEQQCFYNDLDKKDYNCEHFFIKIDNKIVAYARSLKAGQSFDTSSFGRVCVKKSYRRNHLAYILVKNIIDSIFENNLEKTIKISAQHYLIDFYKKFGFTSISEVYLEDGIPHINMKLDKIK